MKIKNLTIVDKYFFKIMRYQRKTLLKKLLQR